MVSDLPSLLEHLDSWVPYLDLHGPEMLSKLGKGSSSRFGDKRWFENCNGFLLSPGKASPKTSKTKCI